VGKSKAEVAATFVEKRVKGVKITPYNGRIQDKNEEYYMQFQMVVCGLDSVEARRWINDMLVGMVDPNNMESLKPLIDGGTEGMSQVAAKLLRANQLTLFKGSRARRGLFYRHYLPASNASWTCMLLEQQFLSVR
jgi:hypothetical protein